MNRRNFFTSLAGFTSFMFLKKSEKLQKDTQHYWNRRLTWHYKQNKYTDTFIHNEILCRDCRSNLVPYYQIGHHDMWTGVMLHCSKCNILYMLDSILDAADNNRNMCCIGEKTVR